MTGHPHTVDEYVASLPAPVQEILQELRRRFRRVVPGMVEIIRYDMPAVMLHGTYVVHFAAWKQHIGLYPVPLLPDALEQQVAPYRSTKDTVRLRYRDPIPYDLVERIAEFLAAKRLDEAHAGEQAGSA